MIDDIYTYDWYQEGYKDIRDDIRAVADCVATLRGPCSVLDVGCGPGILIGRLQELGYDVHGYDGAKAAIEYAQNTIPALVGRVDVRDATLPNYDAEVVDLVICTEVAEHIDPALSTSLVRRLWWHLDNDGLIFFTAAHPGQGGTDHINERPMIDWLEMFGRHSIFPDIDATLSIRERLKRLNKVWWYGRNAVVLRRTA